MRILVYIGILSVMILSVVSQDTTDAAAPGANAIAPADMSAVVMPDTSEVVMPDTNDVTPADTREVAPADTNDVAPPDTNDVAPADTTAIPDREDTFPDDPADFPGTPDDPAADEPEEILELEPREPLFMYTPAVFRKVTNDSLNRWQLWSHHGESITRQPGVVSFQLGGHGRNDGYLIRGHENRHQRIYRDGIPINERIFGSANRKRLPHYSRFASVHENSTGIRYRSDITTQRYHVSRPLTMINYEQTAYDYRSTEGYLTRNITPSTNFSLAYWGKNQDEGYRNNHMGGRNAAVTMYHYLDDFWMLEGGFHYSGLQFGESHGYQINDMYSFPFNIFEVFPNESEAESSMRNALFRVTAYHRESSDHQATSRVSLFHDRYRRFHYDETDSSYVRALSTGITGEHTVFVGPLEVRGEAHSEWVTLDRDRFNTMAEDSWIYTMGKGSVKLPLPNRSYVYSWIQSGWRTDGFADYEIGSMVDFQLFSGISLHGSYARGEQMPFPGQLYWDRFPISGNPGLHNEIIQRAEAGVRHQSGSWNMGGELHASHIERPILVGGDSTFVQAGAYTSAGATGWISLDSRRFEASLSSTFQQYFSDEIQAESRLLDLSGQRVWARASFYYKNYVYNSAAFMKAGFYVQASPTIYRSSQYYPAMDYWDPNSWHPSQELSEAQAIPDFVRVDLDMTARVRSVIFLFRLENALDNWLLPGYFETAYQPMPSMRFRFGLRWVLRN